MIRSNQGLMSSRTKAVLLLVVCVALWALIPVAAKLGQTSLDHHQFLFWSSLVSFVLVFTIAAVRGKLRELHSYRPVRWLSLFGLGFLGTYVYYLLLYQGYARAQGLEVLVFQYSWPLFVVLFSVPLLRERPGPRGVIALLLGFLGVSWVLTRGDFATVDLSNSTVIALVAAGAAGFALFSVLSKKVKTDPLAAVAIYFLAATIASLISMLLYSRFAFPEVRELVPVLVNGLFVNGISYVLWIQALKLTDASRLAPLVFLTPILSAGYLTFVFDEPLEAAHLIGLAVIVVAGLLSSSSGTRKNAT